MWSRAPRHSVAGLQIYRLKRRLVIPGAPTRWDPFAISGAHEERKEEKGKDYVRRERRRGSFFRSVALPPGVDAQNIEAKTHDGVLEVAVPLPQESTKEAIQITPTAA